jgi:hypothetical protein
MFPRITPLKKGSATAAIAEAAGLDMAVEREGAKGGVKGGDALLYDRILCDVPCSGDGTMRKAPDIWRRWSVNSGNGLHNMQLRIALQGIRLLKVGGALGFTALFSCQLVELFLDAFRVDQMGVSGGPLLPWLSG